MRRAADSSNSKQADPRRIKQFFPALGWRPALPLRALHLVLVIAMTNFRHQSR